MWNYRVVKTIDEETQEEWLELCEVYYDTLGKPMGYCKASIIGSSVEELKSVLEMITKGIDRPTLDFKNKEDKNVQLRKDIEDALDSLRAACGAAPKYKFLENGAVYFYMGEE